MNILLRIRCGCAPGILGLLISTLPSAAGTQLPSYLEMIDAIVAADLKVERIGERLATANRRSCSQIEVQPGFSVQSLGAYEPHFRPAAVTRLTFATPLAIEGVVEGSAAARVGIRAGDGLVKVGAVAMPVAMPAATRRTEASDLLEYRRALRLAPVDQPLAVRVLRQGRLLDFSLTMPGGCASRFELLLGKHYVATADGEVVQIGAGFVDQFGDDDVAVVMAHELAHNILGHRSDMDRLSVNQGIAGEFGRSAKIQMRMEDEADSLSVQLLAQAGYDPYSAAAFWKREGRRIEGPIPRGTSHRGWKARALLLDRAATALAH